MCLQRTSRKVRITTKDLTVYKVLRKSFDGTFFSPCQGTSWKRGVTKSVRSFSTSSNVQFTTVLPENSRFIKKGFHAFRTRDAARRSWMLGEIHTAVIPKGTPYLLGVDDEIVALKIQVVD